MLSFTFPRLFKIETMRIYLNKIFCIRYARFGYAVQCRANQNVLLQVIIYLISRKKIYYKNCF